MKMIRFLLTIGLILIPCVGLAEAPHQVGGFVLGKNIDEYREMIKPETTLPIRYMGYLREIEIKETEGFKQGLIWYGTCAKPGRIVRIRLKYADSSRNFYELLLKEYKKRFGEPSEWRGDPFHVIIAWKWSFTDSENNSISLILYHNIRDEEEKKGNVVKLTMWNLIEEERRCFEKKHPQPEEKTGERMKPRHRGPVNWNMLIPR
jgi:hypothetical protein